MKRLTYRQFMMGEDYEYYNSPIDWKSDNGSQMTPLKAAAIAATGYGVYRGVKGAAKGIYKGVKGIGHVIGDTEHDKTYGAKSWLLPQYTKKYGLSYSTPNGEEPDKSKYRNLVRGAAAGFAAGTLSGIGPGVIPFASTALGGWAGHSIAKALGNGYFAKEWGNLKGQTAPIPAEPMKASPSATPTPIRPIRKHMSYREFKKHAA